MEMKDLSLSHARDKKTQASENSMITNTQFLDLKQRQSVSVLERELQKDVKTYYYGGFEDAERVVAVFVPTFFEVESLQDFFDENTDENPLAMIAVSKDKFSSLTHRDYLGSLMGLGIKREMIGDIVVGEKVTYIVCIKSIANYIVQNLVKIGRGSAKLEVVDFSQVKSSAENISKIFVTVSSLRLDNVISTAFNLSRTKASAVIVGGIVFVNGEQKLKNDFKVNEKDKVVLRGKGKIVIDEVLGESKKGKIRLNINRYE